MAEQWAGVMPTSQFGRALGELGVELIPAHSPQAKGRVERLVKTVQGRLVKERRPLDNRRVAVQPVHVTDLHRPTPASRELDRSLCIKTTRCLRRDWTVAYHGHLDQVRTHARATHVLGKRTWTGRCASRIRVGRWACT